MTRKPLVAAAVLVLFKLFLLTTIGPVFVPDSGGYTGFADAMIASRHWIDDADVASQAATMTAFRGLGYPLVIAAAKLTTGAAWPYAVVVLQVAMSTAAFFAVFSLTLNLGLGANWALCAAIAYATSIQLTIDQSIMTDSLNASCIILALTVFLRGWTEGTAVRPWQVTVSGLLLAAAFLIREVLPFLLISLMPLFVIRCAIGNGRHPLARFVPCILVCLPLAATLAALQQWNVHRTGERFVTTGAQINALYAVVRAAQDRPDIFSGDSALDSHARQILKQYDFVEVGRINDALYADGYHGPEIARMALQKYLATWRQHPAAMLNLVRISTSENLLKLAIRPITAVCDLFEWDEKPLCFDYRKLYRQAIHQPSALTWREMSAFIAVTIQNTLSIGLTVIFFAGIPLVLVLAWRNGEVWPDRPVMLAAGFWLLGVGWHLLYAVSVYTDRYLAPVIPFIILGALVAAARLVPRPRTAAAA